MPIFWEKSLQNPRPETDELVEFDPQLIPAMLSAIGGRLGPSHWESEEAWIEGYSRLSLAGARLLMGAKEDIIIELRAARDGEPGHAVYDLATFPVGEWPGPSTRTVANLLYLAPDSITEIVKRIEDKMTAAEAGDAESLAALQQIAFLLGA